MSDERDRAKALGAMRHAITTRPATWTPDNVLDAMVDSGAVVWASNHRRAVDDLRELCEALEGIAIVTTAKGGGKTRLSKAWKNARARLDKVKVVG
jgi:type II secretory pathway predicted ATPase ExeA